jgi:hypothetical protein
MLVGSDGFTLSPSTSRFHARKGFDVMRAAKKRPFLNPPEVRPGNWRGEILGGRTVNFGQTVQLGPPRRSIGFSYLVIPAIFTPQEARFTWPGVILIFAPTPMKTVSPHAGHLVSGEHLLSLSLSLEVTRAQFSDMLRRQSGWLMAGLQLGHSDQKVAR